MAKYVCPVCGKIWYNIQDLADCTAKDAKAEAEATAEKKRIEALKQSKMDALAAAKKDVDVSYAALKRKIDAYNYLANDFNKTFSNKAVTYSVTLTGEYDSRKDPSAAKPIASFLSESDKKKLESINTPGADLENLCRKIWGF